MNVRWSHVWTIFRREVRDQVRDQRTLFMIFVLPVLLYPLIGLGAAKLADAFADRERKVVVVGADRLPAANDLGFEAPPLLNASATRFNPALFDDPADSDRLIVRTAADAPPWNDTRKRRELLRAGEAEAVLIIPANVADTLRKQERAELPIAYNSADERSQLTYLRVSRVLDRWNELIREQRRVREGKPEGATEPVRSEAQDVARAEESGGVVWSKIFPFLLVLMALTGAFYPAVDLCAGEKERGTMETLLISPASRPEIVLGKFFTVMLASNVMALLNLASMGVTAWALARQAQSLPLASQAAGRLLAAPSLASAGWMLLLLAPLTAFFSALCLALAVMARSMKEGQYYMTPLYMVAMPLAFVVVMPGVELDLFTSLLPVTGVSLLLRTLMQGDYELARRYFLFVLIPIVICGLLALRWAVDQFKSEKVLFRAGERFDAAGWLRHLWRDKPPVPSPAQSLLCFVLILVAAWFVMPFLGSGLMGMVSVQVLLILGIPAVLALGLTSDPARTFRLRWPRWEYLALCLVLPVLLFPAIRELNYWVELQFPTPPAAKAMIEGLQRLIPNLATAILIFALVPAICEEAAFRGYILSGLSNVYRPAWAIVLSALLFGFLHVLFSLTSQFFNATLLGMLLGLIALRSGSLVPGIVFHFVNNTLAVSIGEAATSEGARPLADLLFRERAEMLFAGHWIILGAGCAGVSIMYLAKARVAEAGVGSNVARTLSAPASTLAQESPP